MKKKKVSSILDISQTDYGYHVGILKGNKWYHVKNVKTLKEAQSAGRKLKKIATHRSAESQWYL